MFFVCLTIYHRRSEKIDQNSIFSAGRLIYFFLIKSALYSIPEVSTEKDRNKRPFQRVDVSP